MDLHVLREQLSQIFDILDLVFFRLGLLGLAAIGIWTLLAQSLSTTPPSLKPTNKSVSRRKTQAKKQFVGFPLKTSQETDASLALSSLSCRSGKTPHGRGAGPHQGQGSELDRAPAEAGRACDDAAVMQARKSQSYRASIPLKPSVPSAE
jgi:hypothetical protein